MSIEEEIARPDFEILKKTIKHKIVENDRIRSRKELARKAGVAPDTFDNLFKDKRKRTLYADDLYMISQALQCSMEELITGQKPEKTNAYNHPVIEDIVHILDRMNSDELNQILGAVRQYVRDHFGVMRGGQEVASRE